MNEIIEIKIEINIKVSLNKYLYISKQTLPFKLQENKKSEFGVDKQFNPTKLFIDICISLGLASEPKRALGAWNKLRQVREKEIYGSPEEEKNAAKID